MTLTARETRFVLFLVAFFCLGLFVLSQHAKLRPIFDKIHVSSSTSAVATSASSSSKSLRLTWGNNSVPETEVLLHKVSGVCMPLRSSYHQQLIPAGLTVLKNLYIFNGTIYIVTSQPDTVPESRFMISNGRPILPVKVQEDNEPTNSTLSVISPKEAHLLFGMFASIIDGVSFIQTDAPQFLGHMYHFAVG